MVDRSWARGLVALAAMSLIVSTACSKRTPPAEATTTAIDGAISVEDALGFSLEGMLARQARAEVLIRDCMKAQGFEYVPIDPAIQQAETLGVTGMSDEDFQKQYGYGITTLYEQRREQQKKLGPNEAIRAKLGESDQAAYDQVLFGDNPDATFADIIDQGDFTRLGGCTKQAADQVFGGTETVQNLQQKMDELDEEIVADARMADAIKAWSTCMRAAGYNLDDPEELDTVLLKRLEEIVGPAENSGDAAEPTYDKAALTALQSDEVVMVAKDVACEELHIMPVETKVRAEYERDFRDEHAALLAKVPLP